MSMHRRHHRIATVLAGLLLVSSTFAGCGGSGGSGKTVFKGPEEVNQKKADLKEAMQGGAYGASGRKAAPLMGP